MSEKTDDGFDALERQIEALLGTLKSMASERDQMRNRVAELERELAAARTALGSAGVQKQALAKIESERSALRVQVDSLAAEVESLAALDAAEGEAMTKPVDSKDAKDASKKTTVTVQIHGVEYKIKGDADPDYIRKLAAHVDAKMRDVLAVSSTVAPVKVAILASINLADEYFRLREEVEGLRRTSADRASTLADRIAEALRTVETTRRFG